MFDKKRDVYDSIFNRKVIHVKVGLAAQIRLWQNGYYIAYMQDFGNYIIGYYLMQCGLCRLYFLSRTHQLMPKQGKKDLRCPICNPAKF